MHALFDYARWVADSLAITVEGKKVIHSGFTKLIEVQQLLEARLAVDTGGFAFRATIGWFWSLLYWIDQPWLAEHAKQIFDLERIEKEPAKAYGWAAWNTYLTGTNPHIDYYRLLQAQYDYAVEQVAKIAENPDDPNDKPLDRLCEHLMVLYGRGQLTLESDGGIVKRLLTNSSGAVRKHATRFIGISLWREEKQIAPEVRERFSQLWDWYWQEFGAGAAKLDATNESFGYWFVSGAFDRGWALDRLEQFVKVVSKPEPEPEVVEKLVAAMDIDLPKVVRILGCLVDGDDENWRIYGWKEHAKTILAKAMNAPGPARDEAISIVDRLGRKGFVEFGELLPT